MREFEFFTEDQLKEKLKETALSYAQLFLPPAVDMSLRLTSEFIHIRVFRDIAHEFNIRQSEEPEVTDIPVGDEYAYEKTMDAPFLTEKRSGPGFGTTETVFIPAGTYAVTYRRLPDPKPVEPPMSEDEIAMWIGKSVINGQVLVETLIRDGYRFIYLDGEQYNTHEEAAREIKRRMSK